MSIHTIITEGFGTGSDLLGSPRDVVLMGYTSAEILTGFEPSAPGIEQGSKVFSSEPLPIAPALEQMDEVQLRELRVFHRKVLDYLRRLGSKLDSNIQSSEGDAQTIAAIFTSPFTVGTDWTDIVWPLFLHQSDLYTVDNHKIGVREAGIFALHFTFEVPDADGATLFDTRVNYDGLGTLRYGITTNVDRTHVVTMPLAMDPRYPLVIQARWRGASSTDLDDEGSRFMLYRLSRRTFEGGGGGGGGGGGPGSVGSSLLVDPTSIRGIISE